MVATLLADVVANSPLESIGPYVLVGVVVAGGGLWILRGRRRSHAADPEDPPDSGDASGPA